jgi:superfamily II DNA or RNA helicase
MVDLWVATDGREGLVPVETYRPAAPEAPGKLAKSPAEAYVMHGLRGKRNVVFAASIADADRFAAEFRGMGIDCHVVHGKLDGDTRGRYLTDLESGRVKVVVNVYVLTEGFDCPAVEVITLARKLGSVSMLIQIVGRGRRPHAGKNVCTVLDLAGVTHVLGDVDEERILSLEGVGIQRKIAALCAYCKVCGNVLEPGEGCAVCGRPRDEATQLEISGNRLDKFARYKSDDERARAVRFARFTSEAVARGYNPKQAFHRYRGMYNEMPSGRIISQANAIRGGYRWCETCGHGKSCKCPKVTNENATQ